MSGSTDTTKGKIKQRAGVMTDHDRLRRKGRVDELAGKTKDVIDALVEKITRAH
jgi:uncharacterized protein YjbJ (UPF0337 family)